MFRLWLVFLQFTTLTWTYNAASRGLHLLEKHGIYCPGGWTCSRAVLDGYEKFQLHLDSIPAPFRP